MAFLDYLFLGALLNKFKHNLQNHGSSSYANASPTYNKVFDEAGYDLLPEDEALEPDGFAEYDDLLRGDLLYDDSYPYNDTYLFDDDDDYDDDIDFRW